MTHCYMGPAAAQRGSYACERGHCSKSKVICSWPIKAVDFYTVHFGQQMRGAVKVPLPPAPWSKEAVTAHVTIQGDCSLRMEFTREDLGYATLIVAACIF